MPDDGGTVLHETHCCFVGDIAIFFLHPRFSDHGWGARGRGTWLSKRLTRVLSCSFKAFTQEIFPHATWAAAPMREEVSKFGTAANSDGHGLGADVFAYGGLEVGQYLMIRLAMTRTRRKLALSSAIESSVEGADGKILAPSGTVGRVDLLLQEKCAFLAKRMFARQRDRLFTRKTTIFSAWGRSFSGVGRLILSGRRMFCRSIGLPAERGWKVQGRAMSANGTAFFPSSGDGQLKAIQHHNQDGGQP